MRFILTLLPLLYAPVWAISGDSITVKTKITGVPAVVHKELVLHIMVSWPGGLDKYPRVDVDEPQVTNLDLLGRGASGKALQDESGKIYAVKSYDFYYRPREAVVAAIAPVRVYLENKKGQGVSRTTRNYILQVFEGQPEEDKSFLPGMVLLWALIIGFGAAFIFVIARFVMMRRNTEEEINEENKARKYRLLMKSTVHPANNRNRENIRSMMRILAGYIQEQKNISDTLAPERLPELLKEMESRHTSPAEINKMVGSLLNKHEITSYEVHAFFKALETFFDNEENHNTR